MFQLLLEDNNYDLFEKIKSLNERLNNYDYGIPNQLSDSDEYFEKYYKLLSPEEFEKYKCGVCWDYVVYESYFFKKYFSNIKFETYFQLTTNENDYYVTHTFLIFELDKNYYWFESSWKSECGIYKFNNKKECIKNIMKKCKYKNYKQYLCKYNALNKNMYGMNCKEYMNYMIKKIKLYN